jgi:hypothetical protein
VSNLRGREIPYNRPDPKLDEFPGVQAGHARARARGAARVRRGARLTVDVRLYFTGKVATRLPCM